MFHGSPQLLTFKASVCDLCLTESYRFSYKHALVVNECLLEKHSCSPSKLAFSVAWICDGFGLALVWSWGVSDMVWACVRSASGAFWVWLRYGFGVVVVRFLYGVGMMLVQFWHVLVWFWYGFAVVAVWCWCVFDPQAKVPTGQTEAPIVADTCFCGFGWQGPSRSSNSRSK